MKNPFYVLGLSKDLIRNLNRDEIASIIKDIYRTLAIKYHPDKGGNVNKFREITEAFSLLKDDKSFRYYREDYLKQRAENRVQDLEKRLAETEEKGGRVTGLFMDFIHGEKDKQTSIFGKNLVRIIDYTVGRAESERALSGTERTRVDNTYLDDSKKIEQMNNSLGIKKKRLDNLTEKYTLFNMEVVQLEQKLGWKTPEKYLYWIKLNTEKTEKLEKQELNKTIKKKLKQKQKELSELKEAYEGAKKVYQAGQKILYPYHKKREEMELELKKVRGKYNQANHELVEIRRNLKDKVRPLYANAKEEKEKQFKEILFPLIKIENRQIYKQEKGEYVKRGEVIGTISTEDFKKARNSVVSNMNLQLTYRNTESYAIKIQTIGEEEFKKLFCPFLSCQLEEGRYIVSYDKTKKGNHVYNVVGLIREVIPMKK